MPTSHASVLARQGFYNGTTFHRVIRGFMAQGRDRQPGDSINSIEIRES